MKTNQLQSNTMQTGRTKFFAAISAELHILMHNSNVKQISSTHTNILNNKSTYLN